MAYAVKYRLTFDNLTGESHQLDIELEGYAGEIINVEGGADPVRFRMDSSGDSIFVAIKPTSLTITLFTDIHGDYDEFYDIDDRDYRVQYYIESTLEWIGYISGSQFQENIEPGKYEVKLTAYDGLGDLKNNTFPAEGRAKISGIIAACLLNTGLSLDIVEIMDFKHNFTLTTSPLFDTWVDARIFKDNSYEYWKCDKVLTTVLETFGASVRQQGGKWVIARHEAIYGGTFTANHYDVLGITLKGTIEYTFGKTIAESADSTHVELLAGGIQRKSAGIKEAWLKQNYGKSIYSTFADGSFSEAIEILGIKYISAWTLSSAIIAKQMDNGGGSYYAYLAAGTALTEYISQTEAVATNESPCILAFKVAVHATNTLNVTDDVFIELINNYNGSDTYLEINAAGEGIWTSAPTQIVVRNVDASPATTSIAWKNFSVRIPAGIYAGTLTVKLYAPETNLLSNIRAWCFDDVAFYPETYAGDGGNIYLYAENNENFGYVPEKFIAEMGDIPTTGYNKLIYRNWLGYGELGAVPTFAWFYVADGVTDYTISQIRMRTIMNAYSKNLFVKNINVIGNIKPFTIMTDHLGVKYFIISFEGSYKNDIWAVECIEFVEPNTAVPAITEETFSGDPESPSSGSGGGSGGGISETFDIYVEEDPQFPIDYLFKNRNGVVTKLTEIPKANGIVFGGQVTWLGGLLFGVSAAAYYINGILYTTAYAEVELAESDTVNPRIDIIVLDTSQVVSVITGTPAADPQKPTPDPVSQLEVTDILVNAGETAPDGATEEIIYNENTEWTGSSSGVTVNFDSTTSPFKDTKCAEVGAIGKNDTITFTAASAVTTADWDDISFAIKLKAVASKQHVLSIEFFLSGVSVSPDTQVTFNRGDNINWQNISIDLDACNITTATFDAVRFQWFKAGAQTNFAGFYLDYIKLQGGVTQPIFVDTIELTGDVIGSGVTGTPVNTWLKTVNSNVGTFGDAGKTVTITVDAKGRITAVTENTITAGLTWVTAPATKTSAGTAGQIAKDSNYVYICTADNVWKRIAMVTNWV